MNDDTEEWKALVPGKPLLNKFASKAQIHPARAKALYLQAASAADLQPFSEIVDIFREFATN